MASRSPVYSAPIFLGSAFLLMGVALVEKALNLFRLSIPFVDVEPRQLLDWAVVLLVFEIALSMREMIEMRGEERRAPRPATRSDDN